MMALTVADVLGRYLLSSPVKGSTELTELMLAAVIFLGLPAATLDREHVTVDLVADRLPHLLAPLRRLAVPAVSATVQAVIGWRLWVTAAQVADYGGTTISLEIPVAPVGYGAAVLCGFSALINLVQIFFRPSKESD